MRAVSGNSDQADEGEGAPTSSFAGWLLGVRVCMQTVAPEL